MRKIEEQMINALERGVNMSNGNTVVRQKGNGVAEVLLHGVHIATVTPTSVSITDCEGWRSATTKSRLHEILVKFCKVKLGQRNYHWYYLDFTLSIKEPFKARTFNRWFY